MKKLAAAALGVIVILLLSHCSRPESTPDTVQLPLMQPLPAGEGARLYGTIHLSGTPPVLPPIAIDADCNSGTSLPDESLVSANGALADVFVYIRNFKGRYAVPTTPVVLLQKGCRYTPHVLGLQAGQTLRVVNGDQTLHNVHALPHLNRPFNHGQDRQGMSTDERFASPEVMVKFKCDVHHWMKAWVGVLSHPFFSVSATDGSYAIASLPAGTYEVEAWQERLGVQRRTITVKRGEALRLDFTFDAKGAVATP